MTQEQINKLLAALTIGIPTMQFILVEPNDVIVFLVDEKDAAE